MPDFRHRLIVTPSSQFLPVRSDGSILPPDSLVFGGVVVLEAPASIVILPRVRRERSSYETCILATVGWPLTRDRSQIERPEVAHERK